ncbi:hypothetical protein [Halosolutus gelatinilyticus]|uniref:hypothetical protein n=1 Tax=Halosolutus gelatinilyticus TaxID=2931975 RepID=UPI001FF327D9|nr:hypothetical protein [Halosolutus gelatinilyticus]
MTDFQDHFEDMDEEIGEFTDDLTERLEEAFGSEVEISQVQNDPQNDRYTIEIDPVGVEDMLSEELDVRVMTIGGITIRMEDR